MKNAYFNRLFYALLGLMVILVGSSIARAQKKQGETNDGSATRAALAVEITAVTRGSLSEFVFADGNSRAIRRDFLLFESGGRVNFLKSNNDGGPLREGDSVNNGELLAELDRRIEDATARAARAELDTSRATLANAKKELDRARRLRVGDVIQISRFEAIETAHEQALADVRGTEARLERVTAGLRQLQIRAPFDGVVSFVNIREGQYVSLAQFDTTSDQAAVRTAPIVVIDPNAFEIVVELPVVDGRRVRSDQLAYILDEGTLASVQQRGFNSESTPDSFSDLLTPARVASVSPAVDPGSRAIRARVVTNETIERLADGGYVTVWIEVSRRDDAVIIPMEALVYRNQTAYAFVFDSETNKVERRLLKLGIGGFKGMEVLSGLLPDEQVVTKGRFRLASGMTVRQAASINKKQQ